MWHRNSHDSNDSTTDGQSPQGCRKTAEAVSSRPARRSLQQAHGLETEKSSQLGGFARHGCLVPEIPKVPVSCGGTAEENLVAVSSRLSAE